MTRMLTATLLLGLTAGALSGCYVIPAYTYPGYAPAYPPRPAYLPPSSPGPRPGGPEVAPPPSGASPSPAPAVPGGTPGTARNCQTVTVEGHYETHVSPNGQRETAWVPTHEQRVCQ